MYVMFNKDDKTYIDTVFNEIVVHTLYGEIVMYDKEKYIAISIPNDTAPLIRAKIRSSLTIDIGTLPNPEKNGIYSYTQGIFVFTETPRVIVSPPTAEEKAAKLKAEAKKAEREKLINVIRAADESTLTTDEKVSMLFKKVQMELST